MALAVLLQGFSSVGGSAGPIVGAIIAGLGLLWSIFHGGVPKNIRQGFEGLRDSITRVTDALTRFIWWVGYAVAAVVRWIQKVWVEFLRPILTQIHKIAKRLHDLIEKVLKPYLDLIQRIRAAINLFYDRVLGPIIELIQIGRKIAGLMRLARIPGARALDQFLLRLQTNITRPILELLRRTSELASWVNILLDAQLLLQQVILINSLYASAGEWTRMFWRVQTGAVDSALRSVHKAQRRLRSVEEQRALLTEFLRDGTGEAAQDFHTRADEIRRAFPL